MTLFPRRPFFRGPNNLGGDSLIQVENLIYVGGGQYWGSDGGIDDMPYWLNHVAEFSDTTMAGKPVKQRVLLVADIKYPSIGLKKN